MDTQIHVILDRSGSMASIADDTVGGFNEWLSTIAKGQKQGDDIRISVTIFDTVVDRSVDGVPVRACPKLGTPGNPFVPRGGTALFDAVGVTLSNVQKLKKNTKAIAVIITDGQENSSHEWSGAQVNALIEKLTATKKWSFVYLGAGIDAFRQARTMHRSSGMGQTVSYGRHETRAAYAANAGVTSAFLNSDETASASLGADTAKAMGQTVEAPAPPKKPGTRRPSTTKDAK